MVSPKLPGCHKHLSLISQIGGPCAHVWYRLHAGDKQTTRSQQQIHIRVSVVVYLSVIHVCDGQSGHSINVLPWDWLYTPIWTFNVLWINYWVHLIWKTTKKMGENSFLIYHITIATQRIYGPLLIRHGSRVLNVMIALHKDVIFIWNCWPLHPSRFTHFLEEPTPRDIVSKLSEGKGLFLFQLHTKTNEYCIC